MRLATLRLCALAVLVASPACRPPAQDASLDFRATVEVEPVRLGRVERVLATTGTVRAREEAKAIAEAGGRIRLARDPGTGREIAVGDRVARGQVLAEIAPAELGVTSRVEARRQALEAAELDAQRHRRLGAEGLVSELELAQVETRLADARAEHDAARLATSKARVLAPMDGVLTAVTVAGDGEFVSERSVVAEVMDFRHVLVDLDLGAGEVLEVQPGQLARLKPPPGQPPAQGVVERVAPAIDRTSRTFRVEVALENPGWLRPGMIVRADLVVASRDAVPTVPTRAVLVTEAGAHVFVVEAQRAARRAVTPGLVAEDVTEITEGVVEGELVVVGGHETLQDGSRVLVRE